MTDRKTGNIIRPLWKVAAVLSLTLAVVLAIQVSAYCLHMFVLAILFWTYSQDE